MATTYPQAKTEVTNAVDDFSPARNPLAEILLAIMNYFESRSVYYARTGTTNASGNVTFTFPNGLFSVAPVVEMAVQSSDNSITEALITALSNTSCTVSVRRSSGNGNPGAGVIVHLVARPATP